MAAGSSSTSEVSRQALLLVGATQNGKSTLANFLYHGHEYTPKDVRFKMGSGMVSETKAPKSDTFLYAFEQQEPEPGQDQGEDSSSSFRLIQKLVEYTIIDTPGIGDTSEVDEESNLNQLYRLLIEMAERGEVLSGIIICSGFAQLQSQEYTRNVNFYREMFREVFNTNVIIAITNVRHTNKDWIREKLMSDKPWEETLEQQKQWLQSTLGLDGAPVTFMDAMPFSKKACEHAQKMRHMILQHCSSTQVNIRKIMFVRPLPLQKKDEAERTLLVGLRNGLSEGITLADQKRGEIATRINERVSAISELERTIIEWQDQLRQLDTTADYSLGTHGFEASWHFLALAASPFEIIKQYPITKLTVSQGWYEPKELNLPQYQVRGVVKNMLWRRLSTTLSIYTTNRHYYKTKIEALNEGITRSMKELDTARTEMKKFTEDHSEADSVIENYTRDVHLLTKQILEKSKTTHTFDEMKELLANLPE